MSKLYIVGPPHSDKLWDTPWFFECIPYTYDTRETDSNRKDMVLRTTATYLVREERVISLFGRHHRFKEYNERLERLHENYGRYPNQLRIDFDSESE